MPVIDESIVHLMQSRVAEAVQLRTLPESVSSNAFAVTYFAVDSLVKETTFGVGWATNLFENVEMLVVGNQKFSLSTDGAINKLVVIWVLRDKSKMPEMRYSYYIFFVEQRLDNCISKEQRCLF